MSDFTGDWTQVWKCDPPPFGVKFRVLSEEWNDDYTVRTITAWQPVASWKPPEEQRLSVDDALNNVDTYEDIEPRG